MKNLKKIIIVLAIIVTVLILIILFFISRIKKQSIDDEGNFEEAEYIEGSYEIDNIYFKKIDDRMEYFIINSIIEEFQMYINYLDYDLSETRLQVNNLNEENEVIENFKNQGISVLKKMISSKYISDFNIDDEKIYNKLVDYANKDLSINNIYVSKKNERINTFIVYLDVANLNKQLELAIVLDSYNNSFAIMLDDYINTNNITEENILGNNLEQVIESIDVNEYNIYNIPDNSNKEYVKLIFDDYREKMQNNPEKAYDILYEEYRDKRFKGIQDFENYLDEKYLNISYIELSKYQINEYEEYIEYICIDEENNYYIFKEKGVMDYTVQLDTYTIDSQDFIEKYNKGNEQVKVGMNIEKIFQALNNKDYEYVYGKLNETFKNNNFVSVEKLENYMQQNLFDNNKVEYVEFSKEGDIYIYDLKISNGDDEESSDVRNMTVIMKLLDDTDFVMSFSIE